MGAARTSLGAVLVWTVTACAAVAGIVFLALSWNRTLPDDLFGTVGGLAFTLLSLGFATGGVVIAGRAPGNRVGRVFLAIGLTMGLSNACYQYAAWGLAHAPHAAGLRAAAWASTPLGEPVASLLGLSLLLFPDGRLPSRRWRPLAVATLAATALLIVSGAFLPEQSGDPFEDVPNPVGLHGTLGGVMRACDRAGWVLVVVGMVGGAGALLSRLRRATGDERQQLKVVLSVGAVVGAVATLDMTTWFVWPHGELAVRMAVLGVLFSVFAAAVCVAVIRYRLYDVDVAIERTLVYGALTVLLATAYAITALAIGTAAASGSPWATAGATLVVAVVFRPLRATLQDLVDRRFSRARYLALTRVGDFLERLRAGRAAPEAIEPLLRELLGDPELELRFFLPESQVYVTATGRPANDDPSDSRVRTPIERAGAPLGLVLHRPTGPRRPDPLATLVEAGGLAIEIARLRAELRRQLAEIHASRARIVEAGDAERRRIERDLHDGAQQRLISAGLALRHAQHELALGHAEVGSETIDAAIGQLGQAVDELRQLAGGLPPSQLDAGLQPALRELAGRAPLRVRVQATSERFSPGVEAAAYFIACEGLTNAIKHAHASAIQVSARRENGSLLVSVTDDGIGGAAPGPGSGLRGLEDRVAAHGGSLLIDSGPERGTVLTARLPCGS